MGLSRLIIKNFRSIQSLDIPLGPLNAFIGPNNAGKSNILRALNIVLGETWPTNRAFSDKDFFNHDPHYPIEIEVFFDSPLTSDPSVYGFKLEYADGNVEFSPIDDVGTALTWPSGQPKRVSNAMRDDVSLLYLGLERNAEQQLRPTQWTVYGKLLRYLETKIGLASRQSFRQGVESNLESHIRPALATVQQIVADMIKEQSGLTVELRFDILDPLMALKSVRPLFIEGGLEHDPEDVGAGIQSALAVAIAKAYADIVRHPVVVAIEEPELYLHPHGCRHFYKLLKALSNGGVQILYTTHNRDLVNVGDYQGVCVVRKGSSGTTVTPGREVSLPSSEEEKLKMWTKFDASVNEVFFANVVVLTEGFPDVVACTACLEHLDPKFDLDRAGVSIIDCGGLDNIPAIARGLKEFHVPAVAIVDEDPVNQQSQQQRRQIVEILGSQSVFLQSPKLENLFGLSSKPTKVESLKVFQQFLRRSSPPPIYQQVVTRLKGLIRPV